MSLRKKMAGLVILVMICLGLYFFLFGDSPKDLRQESLILGFLFPQFFCLSLLYLIISGINNKPTKIHETKEETTDLLTRIHQAEADDFVDIHKRVDTWVTKDEIGIYEKRESERLDFRDDIMGSIH